jgi:putative drug exporter of the RND superfamily
VPDAEEPLPPRRSLVVRVARRPVTWAILVLVAWWVVGAVAGPLAGRLQEVQKNDNASFLPATAESTEVNQLQARFAQTETFPLAVLFVRDGPLTTADQQYVASYAAAMPTWPLVDSDGAKHSGGKTVGDYLAGAAAPQVVPSQDGKALLVNASVDADSISKALPDSTSPIVAIVETLRYHAKDAPDGLTSYVTGIGGIFADEFKVFGSLDTTLLGITFLVVAILLILVYRSPVLWFVPLVSALLALSAASGVIYALAKNNVLTLNGQSQGILTVLVFGAATDYALLLVARYREELHLHEDHFDAMKRAWLGVVEPISASAATVIIGLLCLLLSELNSNKSTGPVAAIGIACALITTLTALPALLVIPSIPTVLLFVAGLAVTFGAFKAPLVGLGWLLAWVAAFGWFFLRRRRARSGGLDLEPLKARWVFWPKIPHFGAQDEKLSGIWARISAFIGRRARWSWVATSVLLLVAASFVTTLKADGLGIADSFTTTEESVVGQQVLAQHFPAGSGNPAVIIARADRAAEVVAAAQGVPGVTQVVPFTGALPGAEGAATAAPKVVDGLVQIDAVMAYPSDSPQAQRVVQDLRAAVHAVPGADAKVGGFTAINYDTQQSSQRDRRIIIPITLIVILLILMLLLRAIVGPVLLILSVLLSFGATMGICALVFNHVFHFAGADSSFPLFAFVFLVAFGVDYNIFLMTRVREESLAVGTRRGILRGLTVTGGVITSAGLVLAATFSVLGSLPLVFLAELGFAVAFGVLLDTLLVRTFQVPALMYDVGRPIWWPSRLARVAEPPADAERGDGGATADVTQPVG